MFYRFFVDKYLLKFMLAYRFFIIYLYHICIGRYLENKWFLTRLIKFNLYIKH